MKRPRPPGKSGGKLLLLDSNTTTRDLRARVMRRLGMDVDSAADTIEALLLWRPDVYGLVLVDLRSAPLVAQRFRDEIRSASPGQRVAYFVGKPQYLASLPSDLEDAPVVSDFGEWGHRVRTLFEEACERLPRRGSLLEAAWRISARRSLNDPRAKDDVIPEHRLTLSFAEAVRLAEISETVPL
ncbi:MAG: hypothetical protein ACRD2Y_11480 [Terriglobales bacterium]